jgi:peroxiredoxin
MFDRSAITQGRLIQEFGLCDLKGDYRNTSRLRSKGWLALLFFDVESSYSASVAQTMQSWMDSLPADRVSILGVGHGNAEDLKGFAAQHNLTYPIVWDFDDNVVGLYSINSTPTLIVTDARGMVLAKIVGDDAAGISSAKALVAEAVRAAEEAAAKAEEAARTSANAGQ